MEQTRRLHNDQQQLKSRIAKPAGNYKQMSDGRRHAAAPQKKKEKTVSGLVFVSIVDVILIYRVRVQP